MGNGEAWGGSKKRVKQCLYLGMPAITSVEHGWVATGKQWEWLGGFAVVAAVRRG